MSQISLSKGIRIKWSYFQMFEPRPIINKLCLFKVPLNSSYSNSGTNNTTEEAKLSKLLQYKFPKASAVQVDDVSGGCGAMYEVRVESTEFKGLSIVKQHKLITQALKEEIKDMHGLRISTSVPEES